MTSATSTLSVLVVVTDKRRSGESCRWVSDCLADSDAATSLHVLHLSFEPWSLLVPESAGALRPLWSDAAATFARQQTRSNLVRDHTFRMQFNPTRSSIANTACAVDADWVVLPRDSRIGRVERRELRTGPWVLVELPNSSPAPTPHLTTAHEFAPRLRWRDALRHRRSRIRIDRG
ncbi:MAG: hypothetical protein JWQ70_150 [Aeromicrobium sp.]|nr:hypothetical protein [Aeromicrobium sp.]